MSTWCREGGTIQTPMLDNTGASDIFIARVRRRLPFASLGLLVTECPQQCSERVLSLKIFELICPALSCSFSNHSQTQGWGGRESK